jgi:predicted transcriptional regulator
MNEQLTPNDLVSLTTDIVTAYVSNHQVTTTDLKVLIHEVFQTLSKLHSSTESSDFIKKPAVPIEESYTDDFIICLEDGKIVKSLKRYLKKAYSMSPEEYKKRWGLSADYPIVAKNYSERRKEIAKANKLGEKRGTLKVAS